ncbi:hypothetical protein ABZX69_39295 [Streptomyces sp. NPDC004074]|uniref:hypothetical protein n=1 Tax=Streptomyces sp. NPDC004074 TaxID=3154277 RepID=UPI0033A28619
MTGSGSIRIHVALAALAGVLLLLGVFVIVRTAASGGDASSGGEGRLVSGGQSDAGASSGQGQGLSGTSSGAGTEASATSSGTSTNGSPTSSGTGGTGGTGGQRSGAIRIGGATFTNDYPIENFPDFNAPTGCFAPGNPSHSVPLKIVEVGLLDTDNVQPLISGCDGADDASSLVGIPLSQGCEGKVLAPGTGCLMAAQVKAPGPGRATVYVKAEATCTSHSGWPCNSLELAPHAPSPQHPIVAQVTTTQVITFFAATPDDSTPSPSTIDPSSSGGQSSPVAKSPAVETTGPTDSGT